MKISKINEAIDRIPEVEDKVQTQVDVVMGTAKLEADKNQEAAEKIVEPTEEFDRKADCTFGAENQPKPEEAEKEFKKIILDESLFDESLNEEQIKIKQVTDTKTGDKVTISGKNDAEVNLNAKKFAQNHGGTNRYDLTDKPEISRDKKISADVDESLEDELDEQYDDVESFIGQSMQNGNAFCIMGYTANAMRECGLTDEISTMRTRAMSGNYENLCNICQEYLDRCNEIHESFDDEYEVEGLEFVTEGLEITEKLDKKYLEDQYLGKTIRVNTMINPDSTIDDSRYNGVEGVVKHVDDMGQLHGTWGGLAVIPDVDDFEVIG